MLMARTEVRKECPNCGLGVPLDAKKCEFCGWDFEDEDEWMGEINKLEDELVTDRQKFDDTSVDKMIKSTLRKPDEVSAGTEFSAPAEKITALDAVEMRKKTAAPPPTEQRPTRTSPSPAAQKSKIFRIDLANEQSAQREVAPEPAKPTGARDQKSATVAPAAPAKEEKVVRRVVKYSEQKKDQPEGEQAQAAPAQKPTAEATNAPAKPMKEQAEPTKKSFFGHLGKKKEEEGHAAPKEARPMIKVFVCPLCNKEVKETEKKCPGCGAEFE